MVRTWPIGRRRGKQWINRTGLNVCRTHLFRSVREVLASPSSNTTASSRCLGFGMLAFIRSIRIRSAIDHEPLHVFTVLILQWHIGSSNRPGVDCRICSEVAVVFGGLYACSICEHQCSRLRQALAGNRAMWIAKRCICTHLPLRQAWLEAIN